MVQVRRFRVGLVCNEGNSQSLAEQEMFVSVPG